LTNDRTFDDSFDRPGGKCNFAAMGGSSHDSVRFRTPSRSLARDEVRNGPVG
jgi:hypothetical protein